MARSSRSGAGANIKPSLSEYHARRRFDQTPEPKGQTQNGFKADEPGIGVFVVQKHDATRLHYDFRLELSGVLLSWAVTRGPSLNPADKRLAVRTEDHPLEYGGFEGVIPKGNYGAGTVMLWDTGRWEPIGDPHEELANGKLAFNLYGHKMRGRWALVLMRRASEKRENWLLIKERDEEAKESGTLVDESPDSVASGRDLNAIAAKGGIWRSQAASDEKPIRKTHRLPSFVEPQLATLADEPPEGADWLYEIKFDGYRTQIAANSQDVHAYTRTGLDWSERFPNIIAAAKSLDLDGVLMDGEVAVVDDEGRTSFAALQKTLQSGKGGLIYIAFDLLHEAGKNWRSAPLIERKKRLREILILAKDDGVIVYSDHIQGNAEAMLSMAREKKLEGIIAKHSDRPYRSGRTCSWLKIKIAHEQEFVVIGYRASRKARIFSSIILGVSEGRHIRYAGRVGSGFSQSTLADFVKKFENIEVSKPPARDIPEDVRKDATWVKPELVVEIAFNGWTRDNFIRQGHYVGLREDKPAAEVVKEEAATYDSGKWEMQDLKDVRLTHADKILFPDCGVTKGDLASYLAQISEYMAPFAAERLISLVRFPEGIEGKGFFQRHPVAGLDKSWKKKNVKTSSGSEAYLYFTEPRALVAAVQMSAIEFHIWGSQRKSIEKPDRIVFDLDPDEGLEFSKVKDAAMFLRDILAALGLESLAMLSGGKGIHVILPIKPQHDWSIVKGFAEAITKRAAAEKPDLYVATMSKSKRHGKIFIDYFRNERGATAIAPFSPRARPGAPVAWPVDWARLSKETSAQAVKLGDAVARVAETTSWREEALKLQVLTKAMIETAQDE